MVAATIEPHDIDFEVAALEAELDELTKQHVYGKLQSTDGYLAAPTLFDNVPWPPGPSHGIPQEPIG